MFLTKKRFIPCTWLQYYSAITATICAIIGGFDMGWPSASIPKLLNDTNIKVTNDETSWLAVIPLLSSILGTLLAGTMIIRIGRKTIIILLGIPYLTSWLLIAFAYRVEMLYAGRIIGGLASGITFTVIPMYIAEISNADVRGFLGSLPSIGYISGITITSAIGQYLSIQNTALIAATFPVVFLILIWIVPESPYYLIMTDKPNAAKEVLKQLKGVDDIEEDFARIEKIIQESRSEHSHILDLVTVTANRRALIVACGLRSVQQFSGITAITFYAPKVITIQHFVIIYFGTQLFMCCVSSLIVDKFGRKPLLLVSSLGTGLASTVVGVYFYFLDETLNILANLKFVPVIAMLSYIVLHSIGLSNIPTMISSEVFSPNVKSAGLVLSNIYFCLAAAGTSQFFYFVEKYVGLYMAFVSFAFVSYVGTLFVLFCVPETKGKTLEEIVEQLK